MLKRIVGVVMVIWFLACRGGIEQESGSVSSPDGLRVENVRAQLAPGGKDGAVYMEVINGSPVADRLRWVESPAVQDIQTHESLDEQGVVRMRARPDGFEIPSGARLQLREGGKHIMLLGVSEPLQAGQRLLLRLHFDQAGVLEVEASVKIYGE